MQCDLLKNERIGSFVIFLTFLRQYPVFALGGITSQPKKRFKLKSKLVCGQCRGGFRAQRPNHTTRGKHFDKLEIFSKVLNAFETLHDFVERNLSRKNFSWISDELLMRTFNENFMKLSWRDHENYVKKIMKILWSYAELFMKFSRKAQEILLGVSCFFNEKFMKSSATPRRSSSPHSPRGQLSIRDSFMKNGLGQANLVSKWF